MIVAFMKPPSELDRCGDPAQKRLAIGAKKDRRSSLATLPAPAPSAAIVASLCSVGDTSVRVEPWPVRPCVWPALVKHAAHVRLIGNATRLFLCSRN